MFVELQRRRLLEGAGPVEVGLVESRAWEDKVAWSERTSCSKAEHSWVLVAQVVVSELSLSLAAICVAVMSFIEVVNDWKCSVSLD